MATIKKREPLTAKEVGAFLEQINFQPPVGFIEFFSTSNGAEFYNDKICIILWPLTDMIKLNKDYQVDEFATGFFAFGSDGGDTAFCLGKKTGQIYEMPFIGMSMEEAALSHESFLDLLDLLNSL